MKRVAEDFLSIAVMPPAAVETSKSRPDCRRANYSYHSVNEYTHPADLHKNDGQICFSNVHRGQTSITAYPATYYERVERHTPSETLVISQPEEISTHQSLRSSPLTRSRRHSMVQAEMLTSAGTALVDPPIPTRPSRTTTGLVMVAPATEERALAADSMDLTSVDGDTADRESFASENKADRTNVAGDVQSSFAEMVTDTPTDRSVPLVVLDCANIGWAYGIDFFEARGVEIAINYFKALHVEIRAFLPAHYMRAKPRDGTRGNAMMQTGQMDTLSRLVAESVITLVPAGEDDDEYILTYARNSGGFIVSNDHYSDHLRYENRQQLGRYFGDRAASSGYRSSVLGSRERQPYGDHSQDVSNHSTGAVAYNQRNKILRKGFVIWLGENRCGYTFVAHKEFMINPSSKLALRLSNFALFRQLNDRLANKQSTSSIIHSDRCTDGGGADGVSGGGENEGGQSALETSAAVVESMEISDEAAERDVRLTKIVKTLSKLAVELLILDRKAELKYTLLSRISLLLQLDFKKEAIEDSMFILAHIDGNCGEAQALLHSERLRQHA